MLLAFELDDGCDCGSTIMFLEKSCLKRFAWHSFEIPGLYNAFWAHDLAEFPVETVFGAVSVDVGEVPSAARVDIHLFDCHLVFSRPHPLGKELWIRICVEHGVAWRVESAFHSNFRIVRCFDYGGVLCGLFRFFFFFLFPLSNIYTLSRF